MLRGGGGGEQNFLLAKRIYLPLWPSNTLAYEHRGCGLKPRYSSFDDHLKWGSSCHWALSPVVG